MPRQGSPHPLVFESEPDDPGQGAARRALDAGCDVVIAAGGDGTVRAVAEVLRGTEASLGLIPLGTGNLLARNVEVPLDDIATAAFGAVRGPVRTIDTGSIRLEHVDGSESEHAFLVIAGVGTDADVMDDTNEELKAKVGWLAYSEAGFRHLPGKRKKISIALDGGSEQTRSVRSVLFANCGKLQGLDLVPEAKIDDGVLDVVGAQPPQRRRVGLDLPEDRVQGPRRDSRDGLLPLGVAVAALPRTDEHADRRGCDRDW